MEVFVVNDNLILGLICHCRPSTVGPGKLTHFPRWGKWDATCSGWPGSACQVYFCPSIGWPLQHRPLPRFCRYATPSLPASHFNRLRYGYRREVGKLNSLSPHPLTFSKGRALLTVLLLKQALSR